MRLQQLYSDLIKQLQQAGIDTPDLDARIILEEAAGVGWSDIIGQPDNMLAPEQLLRIEVDLQRRLSGEPLSRIYGKREFWGLEFALNEHTLDPRPDTETLIEAALNDHKDAHPRSILDLGTGSGCILITLLSEWPESRGLGVDKAAEAVKMAQKNAKTHNVDPRARFQTGNWGQGIDEKFDLIVSNPPYIANQIITNLSKEVQNHDPILALDGGNDGLDAYRQIFSQLFSLLNKGGKAYFEIGYDQEHEIVRLAEKYRIRIEHVHRDLAGNPRVVEISNGDK